MDALDHKLITRVDYRKSKTLKAATPDQAEPLTHRGLRSRLAEAHPSATS
jgi:hypothetical protein